MSGEWEEEESVLNWVIRVGLLEKVRFEAGEEIKQPGILEKNVLGIEYNQCKSPKMAVCLVCLRKSQESSMAEME